MTAHRTPAPEAHPGLAGRPDAPLLAALLIAGQRLAEALQAENAALAALDLSAAAGLAETKMRATDAFAAAQAAAARTGVRAEGPVRQGVARLAEALATLGTENQRLLQRAVSIQSRVIEVIAGAALPRASAGAEGLRYGATGQRAAPRRPAALALQTRA
jgi:hypothetical protein